MYRVSATAAVWISAWLNGHTATDHVLDALSPWGRHHLSTDDAALAEDLKVLPGQSMTWVTALAALRANTLKFAQIVLPVAGDVRGLMGHPTLTRIALSAGEAVTFPEKGWIAIPNNRVPSSTRHATHWTLSILNDPNEASSFTAYPDLREAEHTLTESLRDSVTTLTRLDISRHQPNIHTKLAAIRQAQTSPSWPAHMPSHTLRILSKVDEVAAILALAQADAPGGALSVSSTEHRARVLQELETTVRIARVTAINAAARHYVARRADSQHPTAHGAPLTVDPANGNEDSF